jgi:CheY-like chemotaxis protein
MKKILLFEPDKEQSEVFSSWIKGEGYEVKSTDNSQQVLPFLSEEKFDILIIDIDFPETTDSLLNLCRILKKDQHFSEFPIAVVTYKKNIEIIVNSIEAGVGNFILKPFETESFLSRLDTIFKQIELKSKGKKVLDLNYINYLIKLTSETTREDFFMLSSVIFNKLIIDKIKGILGEPIIVIITRRLGDLVGEDHGFAKEVRFSNGKILMDKVDKVSKDIPVEKLTIAFRDYVYAFLQLIQTLTSDILTERGGCV